MSLTPKHYHEPGTANLRAHETIKASNELTPVNMSGKDVEGRANLRGHLKIRSGPTPRAATGGDEGHRAYVFNDDEV